MDIETLFNLASEELKGENALIQIQVGNKMYIKRIGDANLLTDSPEIETVKECHRFVPYMESKINEAPVCERTKQNHKSTLKLISELNNNLEMSECTIQFVESFHSLLRSKGYKVNTIAKHMKILKKYINIAIDNDLLNKNPFRKFKIHQEETHKNALTEREIKKVESNLESLNESEKEVAEGFLFSIYSGLRYSDVIRVTKQNIKNINRNKWLVMRMRKTDREVRIPLNKIFSGKGLELVNKTSSGRLFRLPNNSQTNVVLNRIMKKLHIRKHISFHCARHTSATIMLYKGVNLTTIQKILGHQSIKTTQVYSAVTDSTIYKDIKRSFRAA